MLSTLGKIFSRQHFEIIFLLFSQKTGFDISCKVSPLCMKCQILFSGKIRKMSPKLLSAELDQRVVKVKKHYKKLNAIFSTILSIHFSREILKRVSGKQHRSRLDAAE